MLTSRMQPWIAVKRILITGAGVAAFMATLLGTDGLQAADQVTRRSDRVVFKGTLEDMTTTSVKVKQSNGQVQEISVSDIQAVRFDGEPSLLNQAQSNERSGALDTALEKYKQVQTEYDGEDKRLVVELKFLIARSLVKAALANPARVDEAKKAIGAFRTENKSNFRYLEATLLEAHLLSLDTANAPAVEQLLNEVQAAPVKGFKLQAGVQLGKLRLAAKDAAGALAAFEQVITDSSGDAASSGALYDGMLGKAMCQKAQGQADEAVKTLDEVISKATESETETLAEAWVLKGDSLREKGQPKDALMAYLHVDVLYSSEPAAHAEALYHLAALWGPAGRQDRADSAHAKLVEKYPNSTWAKQAGTK
ncbi:MAG: tetratricopeptide repeat protein [Planctomycetaceae bacterium]|nr:tetratricopeptide repeat protein [Planctomycetaceae bacterium]